MADFALGQVKTAVIDAEGPLAKGGRLEKGVINEDEVKLDPAQLFMQAPVKAAFVFPATEAEILFDMNDVTDEMASHPSWSQSSLSKRSVLM